MVVLTQGVWALGWQRRVLSVPTGWASCGTSCPRRSACWRCCSSSSQGGAYSGRARGGHTWHNAHCTQLSDWRLALLRSAVRAVRSARSSERRIFREQDLSDVQSSVCRARSGQAVRAAPSVVSCSERPASGLRDPRRYTDNVCCHRAGWRARSRDISPRGCTAGRGRSTRGWGSSRCLTLMMRMMRIACSQPSSGGVSCHVT